MTEKNKFLGKFIHLLIITLIFYQLHAQNIENNTSTNSTAVIIYPTWLNSSQIQYDQFLTDSYNYFMTPKGNRVWACAMNLAWSQLKRGMLNGQNPAFLNTTELQQKMVDNLNAELFTKAQLSQDSYYVTSGFGQSTVERINVEVRQKFPSRTFLPLTYKLSDYDFISFAYLFKNFNFQYPFTDSTSFNFNNKSVLAFETRRSKQRKQVYYKYYNHSNDFMIGIKTQTPNDEILLWKTNQTGLNNMKFQKILSMIDFYNSMPNTPMARIDKFTMPVIDLEYDRTYQEMLKMHFANPGYQDYLVSDMNEKLKVRVTKAGVTLENQATVVAFLTSSFLTKYFYLNSDFWLIMKEKNKKPYLVMLVRQVKQNWSV